MKKTPKTAIQNTLQKRLHELEEEVSFYHNMMDYIPGHIYWLDRNNRYLGCNQEHAKNIGLSNRAEIVGKTNDDMPWREIAEKVNQTNKEVMSAGQPVTLKETGLVNGVQTTFLSQKVPLKNKCKEIVGILGISININEIEQLQQSLIVAKKEAEAASRAKSIFIANMSHDIRTPLTGIVGMASALQENLADEKSKEQAGWLLESGEQLLNLLNEVLDIVKTDNLGKSDLTKEWFSLPALVDSILALERPAALQKKLSLEMRVDNEVPQYLRTDKNKLHRILLNIIGNAIKFTHIGSVKLHVTVKKLKADSAVLLFSIIDSGEGIEQEHLDKIFERFYRITPSYDGVQSGHGVGLHIVKQYTELLNGTISCKSTSGLGATFILELPVEVSAERPPESLNAPISTLPVPLLKSYPAKLLLVEDNPIALRVLERSIKKIKIPYYTATNGRDALELIKHSGFDLVITDLGLPGLSGIEMTCALRVWENKERMAPTPIIGLTAHASDEVKQQCLDVGMQAVFLKPMTEQILQDILTGGSAQTKPKATSKDIFTLGPDLPDTIEALFELEIYPLFDIQMGLDSCGTLAVLDELLEMMFNKELPQESLALDKAHEQGDWSNIEKLAHKLKSSALYCGTHRLKMACQYLERSQKAGLSPQQEALYAQLMTVLQETNWAVYAYLQGH